MPSGEMLFITYRLHGSLPADILSEIQREHRDFLQKQQCEQPDLASSTIRQNGEGRYFRNIEQFIDKAGIGPDWLKDETIADIVGESIRFRDGKYFDLHAYCIMSNHVHILLTNTCDEKPFQHVLGSMKANSAKRANQVLDRTGMTFWQAESYDHIVRDERSFCRIITYILNNPVSAGLVSSWQDWPHSYCRYDDFV